MTFFNVNLNVNDNENRKLIDNVRGRSLVKVLALASVPLGRAKVVVKVKCRPSVTLEIRQVPHRKSAKCHIEIS